MQTIRERISLYGLSSNGTPFTCEEAKEAFQKVATAHGIDGGRTSSCPDVLILPTPPTENFACRGSGEISGYATLQIKLKPFENAAEEHAADYASLFLTPAFGYAASFEGMQAVERIFLAIPDCPFGRAACESAARIFGKEKCYVAVINSDASYEEILSACSEAFRYGSKPAITEISDIEGGVVDFLQSDGGRGQSTGLNAVDNFFTVAPGQLTVVTGYPNNGKSEFVDQLVVNLWRQDGGGTGIFSPENDPAEHVVKIAEKAVGKPIKSTDDPHLAKALLEIDGHFRWISPEEPTIDAILGNAASLARKGMLKRLVIDPYNEIMQDREKGEMETEYVSRMLSSVKRFAKTYGVHVFFVAHPRKPEAAENEKPPAPGLSAISGSQHWYNKTDNGLVVSRGENDGETLIYVRKIRSKRVGKPGVAKINYDVSTGIYSDTYENRNHIYGGIYD